METIGLLIILTLVLVLPFAFKKVEHNLEIFLFVMGFAAVLITQQLHLPLIVEALEEPLPITGAVLGFGLLFKWVRKYLDRGIQRILQTLSIPVFIFCITLFLGTVASVITAIIASLILVEVISMLNLDKKHETDLVIIACFAIGLGAALTPLGEPLSTIAIAKLRSWPDVNFWYLSKLLGIEILAGILALSFLSIFFHGHLSKRSLGATEEVREEKFSQIFLRSGKVFLFVMALIFLGEGFKPLIDRYVVTLSSDLLYWINMSSAVLDNATLTAAEISPSMTPIQIKKLLMGLLISGGMLIPGNIPNIIAASKLQISMKDWARRGVPLGLILMVIYFVVLKFY